MALSLAILMLFLALGSGTAVWAAEATGSSTLEQHLEKGYVTQQDLRSAPYNVETEDAAIPAKYFAPLSFHTFYLYPPLSERRNPFLP